MEDTCFTVLCWFLPYISMIQPQVYTRPLPPEPPSRLLPHPPPLGCRGASDWAPCVVLQISTDCLFHIQQVPTVYFMCMFLCCPFIPSSPRPGFCTTSSASQETPQSQANSPWKLQTPSFVLVSPTRLPQPPQAPGRCQYFQ